MVEQQEALTTKQADEIMMMFPEVFEDMPMDLNPTKEQQELARKQSLMEFKKDIAESRLRMGKRK